MVRWFRFTYCNPGIYDRNQENITSWFMMLLGLILAELIITDKHMLAVKKGRGSHPIVDIQHPVKISA